MDLKNMNSYNLVFHVIDKTFQDLIKCKDFQKSDDLMEKSPHTNIFAFLLYKISILIESEFGEYNYFSNYKELYEKVNVTAYLIEEQVTLDAQAQIINDARKLQSYNIALYSLIFSMFASYAFIEVNNFNKLQELNEKKLTKAIENKKASQLIDKENPAWLQIVYFNQKISPLQNLAIQSFKEAIDSCPELKKSYQVLNKQVDETIKEKKNLGEALITTTLGRILLNNKKKD